MAREIGEIQKQCGLKEPVEDFVEQVSKFYILVELFVLLILKCNVNHQIQILDSLSVLFFARPSQFRFGLAEVVFEWAKGTPFGDICNLTDVQEGVIVRCIQRLDETCR